MLAKCDDMAGQQYAQLRQIDLYVSGSLALSVLGGYLRGLLNLSKHVGAVHEGACACQAGHRL